MKVLINTLTADLFLKLYTSVGWIAPCKEQVERALENTLASFVAYEDDKQVVKVSLEKLYTKEDERIEFNVKEM